MKNMTLSFPVLSAVLSIVGDATLGRRLPPIQSLVKEFAKLSIIFIGGHARQAGRRHLPVHEPELWVRVVFGSAHHRLLDHAPQEEPRRVRAQGSKLIALPNEISFAEAEQTIQQLTS